MKIAYLILAHDTPNHLRRLVNALQHQGDRFFIHIDKKSDIRLFGTDKYDDNVIFLEKRLNLWWGEYSIVHATLDLMSHALFSNSDFDYFILLSGSDYPIRSRIQLNRYLAENYGTEFINLTEMPNDVLDKNVDRLLYYRFQKKYDDALCANLINRVNSFMRKIGITRDYSNLLYPLKPFAGSQWWALTRDACHYILSFVEENQSVVHFFKNTHTPDESFFQTIIGNSSFRQKVGRNLTYADWQHFGPPFPACINMWHIDLFRQKKPFFYTDSYGSGELFFARKFPDESEALVDEIDRLIDEQ